jgi:hypothetical protein
MACQTAEAQGLKYKQNIDQQMAPHKFIIGQKVWLPDNTALGKNS